MTADKILQLLEKGKSKAARACPGRWEGFCGKINPLCQNSETEPVLSEAEGNRPVGWSPTPPFFTSFHVRLKVLRANGDVKNGQRLNVTSVKKFNSPGKFSPDVIAHLLSTYFKRKILLSYRCLKMGKPWGNITPAFWESTRAVDFIMLCHWWSGASHYGTDIKIIDGNLCRYADPAIHRYVNHVLDHLFVHIETIIHLTQTRG